MIRSMFSAVTGLRSHQTMLDVIGNNIANVNTVGFKTSRVVFTDVFYQTLAAATAPTVDGGGTNGKQVGYGSTTSSIDLLNTQSGFMQTDKPTDLYISGEGYFAVRDAANNISYTRVGNMTFDGAGNLVDASGRHVLGAVMDDPATAGVDESVLATDPQDLLNIKVDMNAYDNVSISSNGQITGIDSSNQVRVLGTIALATFANPDGLAQQGGLNMTPTSNSGNPVIHAPGTGIAGVLQPGGLEMSNVDLSKQFTDMIIAQRGFQANSRVITTSDEVLQELVNLKR